MKIEDYIENLQITKNEIGFYKCPYCDYTNADIKTVKKHIKSKHFDIISKEVEKINKQNQQRKSQRKGGRKQQKTEEDYKDYMLIFAHKKKCRIHLDNGMIVEGLVKAKDKFNIMVLDAKLKEKDEVSDVERIIIQKGHIVALIPLEE
ncbi:C2H2-type zinc finger protein (plasmid) [Methanocaldococcus indicus]|uniref:C2H2-type zinc finger protein n=1 Tax=Methanocaldococcus indicus TaxID=213231 RepID=UPI0039C9F75A